MTQLYNTVSTGVMDVALKPELMTIIDAGFIELSNMFFLRALYSNNKHLNLSDFPDKTGFECFVNSFHIDDYVEAEYVGQSIIFLSELFRKWNEFNSYLILKGIVSVTPYGANVKFHVVREHEYFLDENKLDELQQPIAILTSYAE